MRRRRAALSKKQIVKYGVGLIVLSCLAYFFLMDIVALIFHAAILPSRFTHIKNDNALRYEKFRQGKPIRIIDSYNWKKVQPMYQLYKSLHFDNSKAHAIRERCKSLHQLDQLADNECRAEWLYYLETGKVVEIKEMLGFQFGKKAGMTLQFEDGRKAMYKPCGSGVEWPENEIRSSHLDFALGFNRAAPSVMRNFTYSYFKDVLDSQRSSLVDSDAYALSQMESTCSDNGVFYGATIGWFNDLELTDTIMPRMSDLMTTEEVNNLREHLSTEYLTDITENHVFFYLLGYIRDPGHNEYKVSNGSLISVDLDRAKWHSIKSKNSPANLTFCHLCTVSERTITKLQNAAEDYSLAIAVSNSLTYDPFKLLFSPEESSILQKRIDIYFTECLTPCIEKYGRNNVIVHS